MDLEDFTRFLREQVKYYAISDKDVFEIIKSEGYNIRIKAALAALSLFDTAVRDELIRLNQGDIYYSALWTAAENLKLNEVDIFPDVYDAVTQAYKSLTNRERMERYKLKGEQTPYRTIAIMWMQYKVDYGAGFKRSMYT